MEILSRVGQAKGPGQLRLIHEVLVDLRRQELLNYLGRLLDDEPRLNTIAKRSSVHANGFTKLVLERRDGLALRLHVWEPAAAGQQKDPENIHDHVWSFGSKVLLGGLDEERFETASGGVVMDHYRYARARATLPPGSLELLGQVRLAQFSELSHRAGTVYHVDDTIRHRAWSVRDGGHVATLVLTGTPRNIGASVYASAGLPVRQDAEKADISSAIARRLISVIIEVLE
jgi:hypothetical protein